MPSKKPGAYTRQPLQSGRLVLELNGSELTVAPVTIDQSKLEIAEYHLRELYIALGLEGSPSMRFMRGK